MPALLAARERDIVARTPRSQSSVTFLRLLFFAFFPTGETARSLDEVIMKTELS